MISDVLYTKSGNCMVIWQYVFIHNYKFLMWNGNVREKWMGARTLTAKNHKRHARTAQAKRHSLNLELFTVLNKSFYDCFMFDRLRYANENCSLVMWIWWEITILIFQKRRRRRSTRIKHVPAYLSWVERPTQHTYSHTASATLNWSADSRRFIYNVSVFIRSDLVLLFFALGIFIELCGFFVVVN